MRLLAKILIALGVLLVLFTGAVAGLVATQPGRDMLVRVIEGAASGPDLSLKVGTISGNLLSRFEVAGVTVGDSEGEWLTVGRTTVDWRPSALLGGTLAVDLVDVERVAVARTPASGGETPADSSGGGTGLPVKVALGRAHIAELDLGEPVIGTAARLDLTASATLANPADGLSGEVDINRLDGAGGKVAGRFAYRPEGGDLTVKLDASEPQGGLIAGALGLAGSPEMRARVDGDGTLDDWNATLAVEAGDVSLASGNARIARAEGGRRLTAHLESRLDVLMPEDVAPLFGGNSVIEADALIGDDDTVTLRDTSFTGETVAGLFSGVATLSGEIRTLNANLFLIGGTDAPVELPVPGGEPVRVGAGQITAMIGQGDTPDRVDYRVTLSDVAAAQGEVESVEVRATGERETGAGFPAQLASDVSLAVRVNGIAASDPAFAQAVGSNIFLSGMVRTVDGGVELEDLQLDAGTATASFTGTVKPDGADGTVALESKDLKAFSGLAGQSLSGAVTLSGTGRAALDGTAFSLNLDGRADNVATGTEAVDGLLAGEVTLTGGVARTADTDISFDDFDLTAPSMTVRINGAIDDATADLAATGTLSDLSKVSPSLAGAVDLEAGIEGTSDEAGLTLSVTGERVEINGQSVEEPAVRFTGEGSLSAMEGPLSIAARFAGEALDGKGHISFAKDGSFGVRGLDLTYAAAHVSGAASRASDGEMGGNLVLAVPDLSTFEAIAGQDLAGALDLEATLSKVADGSQRLVVSGKANAVRAGTTKVGEAVIDARVDNALAAPVANGRVDLADIDAGGLAIPKLAVTAEADSGATRVGVDGTVSDADISAAGRIGVAQSVVTVDLERMRAATRGIVATLAEPSRVVVDGGTVRLSRTVVAAGDGRIAVEGSAGEALDLSARIDRLPMALAGAFAEGLDPAGIMSGTVSVKGAASAPQIAYVLDWTGASVAAMRDAGVPAMAISAKGETQKDRVGVDVGVTGIPDMSLNVTGSVPMDPDGALDLAVRGTLPLSLANGVMAARGSTFEGGLDIDLKVAGAMADPDISGQLSSGGGRIRDPQSGTDLQNLRMSANVTRRALAIDHITAETEGNGQLTVSGTVGLDPAEGIPADLKIIGRDVRLKTNNNLVDGSFDTDLTVTGPLASRPEIAGRITLGRTLVSIPDGLPASIATLDVKHRNAPEAVRAQDKELKGDDEEGGEPLQVMLDLTVDAGNRVFIRGRGLDVVMGGALTMKGPASDPVVDGGFRMRDGTLALLGRRLTFSRGVVDFDGSFDPILDFEAQTTTSSATITVFVTGDAANPRFRFESSPSLPQDEVLARLLFDRPVDQLSAFQIAQLGAEAARLGGVGGSGPGVLDNVRKELGVDVLDVTSTEEGGAAVSAGRYIDDNLYVGVQQGTTAGSSRAVIDLNLTRTIKARGEVGSDGSSKVGIGVEWDY